MPPSVTLNINLYQRLNIAAKEGGRLPVLEEGKKSTQKNPMIEVITKKWTSACYR